MLNRTKIGTTALAACAGLCLSGAAFAQVTELEPNDTKAAATPATLNGILGGTAAQLTGTTTGLSTTSTGIGSADYWRIKTAPAALGIYRHQLVLTTAGTLGHTVTLRGLSQSAGVIGTSDTAVQTGSTLTSPSRTVVWYGFGKEEELFYRATGTSSTTGAYTGTLSTTTVAPVVASGTIFAGAIEFRTQGTGTFAPDSEIWLYDANLNAIAGAGNDDEFATSNLTSRMVRTLTPGTYFMAVSRANLANNQASPADDDWRTGNVLDFPNAILTSSVNPSGATGTGTMNLIINDGVNPASTTPLTFPANTIGDVQFVQFTVSTATIPTGVGSASPNPVAQGASTTLNVTVTAAAGSSLDNISTVSCDIASLTGNPSPDTLVLTRDGVTANWTGVANVNAATTTGSKTIPFSIIDSTIGTPGSGSFSVSVIVPPPANDQCANAIIVSTGAPAATGNNATATDIGDPSLPTACTTQSSKGVWYSFTAGSSGIATISTEGSTQADTVLAVFDACGGTQLACDDDSGTGNLSLINLPVTSGQTIQIMVRSWGTTAVGGAFNLNISIAPAGACCNNNTGVCTITTAVGCTTGSTYQGDGSLCSPNPCPPTGSCCATAGTCTVTTSAGCASPSVWTLAGVCSPNTCPQPSACCLGTNACVVIAPSLCTGTFGGTVNASTTCTAALCGASTNQDCASAIALTEGQLYVGNNLDDPSLTGETPAPSCQGSFKQSVWFSFTAPATAAYRVSACGSQQDTVLNVFTGTCAGLTELPTDTTAGTDGCDDAACNGGTGEPGPGGISGSGNASNIASTRLVAGTTYLVRVSTWGSGTAGNYQLRITYVNAGGIGSCCETSGACTLTDATGCSTGTFLAGGSCSPNICPQPTSTCCRGSTCSVILPANCLPVDNAGASTPAGSSCNATGVNTSPCCFADYNKTGGIEINDIFNFLNDWFASSTFSDFGGDGTVAPDINDIFDFLNAWFAGGC